MKERYIYAFLWEHGKDLFNGPVVYDSYGKRLLKAVISGFSDLGVEMLKALIWYVQVKDWYLNVSVITDGPQESERLFTAICPEIMAPGFNGARVFGDPCYHVGFSSCCDSEDLDVSFCFISEGGISSAASLYSNAMILTEAEVSEEGSFGSDVLEELERAAYARHALWGSGKLQYGSYEYRSSIASAMHIKLRRELEIPGADRNPESRTDSERDDIERMEHARWSAWLRTEGWCYAPVRDNAQKKHNLLIPFEELDEKEKAKDNV